MVRNLVIIGSSIIVLLSLSPRLTGLILLLVPVYLIISTLYSRNVKVLIKKYQNVQAELSAEVAEKFSGIQLVKAFST